MISVKHHVTLKEYACFNFCHMSTRMCKIVLSSSACPCLRADVIPAAFRGRLGKGVGGWMFPVGVRAINRDSSLLLELLTCRLFGWGRWSKP